MRAAFSSGVGSLISILAILLVTISSALAAPTNPFADGAPSFSTAGVERQSYNSGDWGVAEQRGSATYTFSFDLPPGRNGMAPALALRYSSASPLRGLAAGWSFDLPSIRVDRSQGVAGAVSYQASLGGAEGRLVTVPDLSPFGGDAYRVEFDDSFTRFFHIKPDQQNFDYWIALTADGVTHYLGNEIFSTDGQFEWRVTRQVDAYGNEVHYNWTRVTSGNFVDYAIESIEYGANASAGLAPHARVEFGYAPVDLCANSTLPVGASIQAATTNANGANGATLIEHARRLTSVRTLVSDEPGGAMRLVKEVALTYMLRSSVLHTPVFAPPNPTPGLHCTQAPLRYLTQIDIMAFDRQGTPTGVPPIKFSYGNRIDTNAPTTCLGPPGSCDPPVIDTPDFAHTGTLKGVQRIRFDLDADGLPDLLRVTEANSVCILEWQRGLLGGGFDSTVRQSPLPTATWHQPRRTVERCTANGQTVLRDRDVLVNGVKSTNEELMVLGYHFLDYTGDGRVDLLTNIWAGFGWDTLVPPSPLVIQQTVTGAAVEATLPPSVAPVPLQPETSGSDYRWRVYRNALDPAAFTPDPDVAFSQTPLVVTSPKPLPLAVSDDRFNPITPPLSILPVLFDLDGDGFLDVIDIGSHPNLIGQDKTGCDALDDPQASWCVYFGHGGAGFAPGYEWIVPVVNLSSDAGSTFNTTAPNTTHLVQKTVALLRDINGDGLSDLVVRVTDGSIQAHLSTGMRFQTESIDLGANSVLEEQQTDFADACGSGVICDGERGYRRRLIDLDGDGLLDLISFAGSTNSILDTTNVSASFNWGDRFSPFAQLDPAWAPAKRLFRASAGNWWVQSDFVDVTGDGLGDISTWLGDPSTVKQLTYRQRPGLPSAPDLLRRIDNGRGETVDFSYGLTTDTDLVSMEGGSLPAPDFVVAKVTINGGFNTLPMITRYNYAQPARISPTAYTGIDEPERFQGFRKITVTTIGNNNVPLQKSTRVYTFGAEGSPSGRVVDERIYAAQGNGFALHSYTESTWQSLPLFDGQVTVVLPDTQLTRTCRAGIAEADCLVQNDNLLRRQFSWAPAAPSKAPGGILDGPQDGVAQPEIYLQFAIQEGSGSSPGAGDRRASRSYQVRYGQPEFKAGDYRILTTGHVDAEVQNNGGQVLLVKRAEERTTYGSSGLPVLTDVRVDDTTTARTERTYDPQTGNVLSLTKPVQGAGGGSTRKTEYTYDAQKLFVHDIVNELGHRTITSFDVATGALLERRGPNQITLSNNTVVLEREVWVIDGLGRVLEHAQSVDDPGQGYVLQTIQRTSYFDQELPNRVRIERPLDFNGGVFVTSEQTVDGRGRVLSSTEFTGQATNAVSSYVYDAQGNLAAIDAPDPRIDDGATVRFTYGYDGLGRLELFSRPDGSGVAVSHDGLDQTIQEVAADNSGAKKQLVNDVFGRLVEVQEFYPNGPSAITRYHYSVKDQLVEIVDADGSQTVFEYDLAGHRIGIARGSRTWRYTYDLNGNMLTEQVPLGVGADPALYTTTYAYDDLDRVVTKSYADLDVKTLAAVAQPVTVGKNKNVYLPIVASNATVAASPGAVFMPESDTRVVVAMHYFYDTGTNGVGRLARVELPFGTIKFGYEARGLIAAEERSFTLSDIATAAITQRVDRQYNALGQLTLSRWDDGVQSRLSYDARGLVNAVEWLDPAVNSFIPVAEFERSLLGTPRTRASFGQTRQMGYDILGRPVSDSVTLAGQAQPLTDRAYSFTGSGDLAAVSGATNGHSAVASYTYDAQHRLLTANGPSGYSAAFTHSPAGNTLSANVTWSGSPSARNVTYAYGTVDPQAVDRLVPVGGGVDFAAFQYDLAGNMIRRTTPQGTTHLQWDGFDRLRTAQTAAGKEVYLYDHVGVRMLSVSSSAGIRFWFGERETHFTLSGAPVKNYLHLSAGGPTLARVENNSEVELQYADALHNLMVSLDRSGNVTGDFLYGAFGEVTQATGAATHRRQFNGKESDAFTGLSYYGARYYDPLALRWTSADPLYRFAPDLGLDDPGRQNLYTFSLNNPLRYYDPDGLDAKDGKSPKQPAPCKDTQVEDCKDDDQKDDGKPDQGDETTDKQQDRPKTIEDAVKQAVAACQDGACLNRITETLLVAYCAQNPLQCSVKSTESGWAVTGTGARSALWMITKVSGPATAQRHSQLYPNTHSSNESKIGNPTPGGIPMDQIRREIASDLAYGDAITGNTFGAILGGSVRETALEFGASKEQANAAGQLGAAVGKMFGADMKAIGNSSTLEPVNR